MTSNTPDHLYQVLEILWDQMVKTGRDSGALYGTFSNKFTGEPTIWLRMRIDLSLRGMDDLPMDMGADSIRITEGLND